MQDSAVIIVIDPGHGGENKGAEFDGYTEKEMTLVVAKAMKEELEQYDNVTVYLTREEDKELSLEERAEFAADVDADFLFSLHFNASVSHRLYGSEIWVPAFDEFYVKGRQFGEIWISSYEDMGLFSRGIKTRLNDRGGNYYGILRCSSNLDIPSALLEHCHMDNGRDTPYFEQDTENQLVAFGKADAEAVAAYFGLSSTETGKDFTGQALSEVEEVHVHKPDTTPPEHCEVRLLSVDSAARTATVIISASDEDNYIQYYSYAIDGNDYGELFPWPRLASETSLPECEVTILLNDLSTEKSVNGVIPSKTVSVTIAVNNQYDLVTESESLTVELPEIVIAGNASEDTSDLSAAEETAQETMTRIELPRNTSGTLLSTSDKLSLILLILLISIFITVITVFLTKHICLWKHSHKKQPNNRRRNRKKR